MEKKKYDPINHPKHYCREGGMECLEEMELVFGANAVRTFCLLNAWKYRYRAADKNGAQDLNERNVRRWESRDGLPSPVMLCRMAEIFSCTTDALLGRERDEQRVFGATEEDAGRGDPHGGAGDPAV